MEGGGVKLLDGTAGRPPAMSDAGERWARGRGEVCVGHLWRTHLRAGRPRPSQSLELKTTVYRGSERARPCPSKQFYLGAWARCVLLLF